MRRLLACLTAIAFSLPTAVGVADAGTPGGAPLAQSVVADNSKAATVLARSGLVTVRASGPNAGSPSNLAQSNAHDCTTPCQAIAAAFQIVLVPSGTTTQAPQNVALATNVNCEKCGSFAYAYQYVVNVTRDVTLSGHARHQIAQLRREAAQDVQAGLDYPMLDTRLHDLATRFRAAVDGDLSQQHVGEDHKHSFQTVKQHPAG